MKNSTPASLLSIPLVTAFAGGLAPQAEAAAIDYAVNINTVLPLTQSYLFAIDSSPIVDIETLGAFSANANQTINYTDNTDSAEFNELVFIGSYQNVTNTGTFAGITISLLNRDALLNSTSDLSFEALFPNADSVVVGDDNLTAEDRVVNGLVAGPSSVDFEAVESFVNGFLNPQYVALPTSFTSQSTVTLGNFSTLSVGGTLGVTRIAVIPEPASLALLGLGGLTLMIRRR